MNLLRQAINKKCCPLLGMVLTALTSDSGIRMVMSSCVRSAHDHDS